jgi:SHS2 domain-containing protein
VPNDFETLEHTADTGIVAYGKDLRQAFTNAARGLFSLITELEAVEEVLERDIEVNATDWESLLVAWLNELIYIFDTENVLFKRFDITRLCQRHLVARSFGEKVDRARHNIKTGVKAATYHMLAVEQQDGWRLQVLFDI